MRPGINITATIIKRTPAVFVIAESIIQKEGATATSAMPLLKQIAMNTNKINSSRAVLLSFLIRLNFIFPSTLNV